MSALRHELPSSDCDRACCHPKIEKPGRMVVCLIRAVVVRDAVTTGTIRTGEQKILRLIEAFNEKIDKNPDLARLVDLSSQGLRRSWRYVSRRRSQIGRGD